MKKRGLTLELKNENVNGSIDIVFNVESNDRIPVYQHIELLREAIRYVAGAEKVELKIIRKPGIVDKAIEQGEKIL